jgi:carboxymethylenebutenolidase
MASDRLTVSTRDGKQMDAYVSTPASGQGPAVVVIQEIFGVNEWLRGICDWLAKAGFISVAPDLFHRLERNVQLTDKTDEEWKKAFWFYENFDVNQGVLDLMDTVEAARKLPGCNGKVGTIGFCLGGKLAYLMAARSQTDANVGYYGVQIEKSLDEDVSQPLVLHIAEADPYVNHEAQAQIKQALRENKQVTIHVYPGQDHAFTREGGAHYDKASADLAHKRTVDFLAEKLGSTAKATR